MNRRAERIADVVLAVVIGAALGGAAFGWLAL